MTLSHLKTRCHEGFVQSNIVVDEMNKLFEIKIPLNSSYEVVSALEDEKKILTGMDMTGRYFIDIIYFL